MELTFYQKADQPDPDGKLMIHCRVCWQSQKVRFSTGEKVLPTHFKSEKVKATAPHAAHINRTLGTYRSELESFFYRNQNDPVAPALTVDDVKGEVRRIRVDLLKKKAKPLPAPVIITEPAKPSLLEFIPIYIADMKASRSKEWGATLKTVKNRLKAFNPAIDWPLMRINLLNQFKVFLQEEEELSDNTIHAYISLLRGVVEYAERNGIQAPRDIFWVEARATEVIRPRLETGDEEKIINARLEKSDNKNLKYPDLMEKVRWFFLLACHTGLRRSDQWQYINPRIEFIENVPCLMALQQKTGNRVSIPLSDTAYHLLKNPVASDKPPGSVIYNDTLRLIGQQAKLDRIVTVGSFYKGELHADTMPLHEAMTSHMARHTFAARMTAGNINTYTLKELMGHSSISSTQKYQSVSNADIVKQTLEAWKKQKQV